VFFSEPHSTRKKYLPQDQVETGCYSTPEGKAFLTFMNIQATTICPFAKAAKIIDHFHWNTSELFEHNLATILKVMHGFINKCSEDRLDGFLISAPSSFSKSPAMLGEFLRRILFYLSDRDPSEQSCLDEVIHDPSWRYRFGHMHFFVTTFSPCYGEDSTRSTKSGDQTFIMFQPKSSFRLLLSSSDASKHNQHQYVRDKFCRGGVPYNSNYLECYKFVHPLQYSDEPIAWWEPKNNFDFARERNNEGFGSLVCNIM
jgi:hypothetical protein